MNAKLIVLEKLKGLGQSARTWAIGPFVIMLAFGVPGLTGIIADLVLDADSPYFQSGKGGICGFLILGISYFMGQWVRSEGARPAVKKTPIDHVKKTQNPEDIGRM